MGTYRMYTFWFPRHYINIIQPHSNVIHYPRLICIIMILYLRTDATNKIISFSKLISTITTVPHGLCIESCKVVFSTSQ